MIKRMLVILILLISFLCLTSVSASDFDTADLEAMDDSVQVQKTDNPVSLSSSDASDVDIGLSEEDNVFIGRDEGDSNQDLAEGISSDEDDSSTNKKTESSDDGVLSTNKKTEAGDSNATQLELDNDADKENVKVGDSVTWILEAKNNGPNLAKNVKVLVQLPNGLKLVKYSATKGVFNISTGIWEIGDLEAGEEHILKIVTEALTPGEKINKANLTSDTESTTPDECYEEEEINVFDYSKKLQSSTKIVSSKLYPTGNPIAFLLVSLLVLLTSSIKRIY